MKYMHWSVVAASLVIVFAGIKAASVIVVPLLLALFIAVIVSPLFLWFHTKGLPKGVALAMVLVLV